MFEMVKGRIHSFETFGTVDGPGIRFVVFMQGCPLRCLYCHNRDTRDVRGGKEYTPEEVINEMKKYINYINFSGGGITVTGGEPTLQAEFTAELFKMCKKMGVHTSLDTSGFSELEKVRELLDYTDLVLLDLKHASDEKHKEITGVGLDKIRRFAYYLSEKGIPIWIRYVLVPGYTDSEEDLRLASDFIRELRSVEKVEVLPYHCMGRYKWESLGEKYPLEGIGEPSAEDLEKARRILVLEHV
jgi:pyruvate formate lyase activating enzyme